MSDVAERFFELKNTTHDDPELQKMADYITDEKYRPGERMLLPVSFTDGVQAYIAHLLLERNALQSGIIDDDLVYCLAEVGEKGRIVSIPWQVAQAEEDNIPIDHKES